MQLVMIRNQYIILLLLGMFICSCTSCKRNTEINNVQIAFLADVHLSDIYGEFEDCNYKGILNPLNHKYANIRTMKSQLHSTRIFNENYFAFRAALDNIAERGIKYVVLPGDFSDDGQPYNVRALRNFLNAYKKAYGIEFFAINGNHDPVAPYTIESGKTDFLGKDGKDQVIMSKEGMYVPKSPDENPVIITKDIRKMGYEQIVNALHTFGFYPQESYKYWETPFSEYSYGDYSFEKAIAESAFQKRSYVVDSLKRSLPDVSYLVEPVDGLWLLALDGNVFVPSDGGGEAFTKAQLKTGGEYSNILAYKKHLIKWVSKVVKESKRLNKTLIAFSHYPMIDFYDGAADNMKSLFGVDKMQLHRVPDEEISKLFAKAGIKIHFGGHMHLNDTGIRYFDDDTFLINIQVPSLAGYPAAYKILTIKSPEVMEVNTVKIDHVPGFNELFPLYQYEYSYLKKTHFSELWNQDILSSQTYGELVNWHLKELVRLRFLKEDWPAEFKKFMMNSDGKSLLKYAGGQVSDSLNCFKWGGYDMIFDFYRLITGDQLAIKDIGKQRINEYQTIIDSELNKSIPDTTGVDSIETDFYHYIRIFNDLLHSEPSDHFSIDMKSGVLTNIE